MKFTINFPYIILFKSSVIIWQTIPGVLLVVTGGTVSGVVPSGGLVWDGVVPSGGLVWDGVVPSGGLVWDGVVPSGGLVWDGVLAGELVVDVVGFGVVTSITVNKIYLSKLLLE